MTKNLPLSLVVLALSLLVTSAAHAQPTTIDAERFKPAVTTDEFVTVEGSGLRPKADPWEIGAYANYSRNSLIFVDGNDHIAGHFISGRLGMDVLASVTLAKPFAIGLDVPFFLAQTGDGQPSFGGLGDVRLVPKIRFVDGREGLGLALVPELRAPTHVGDFAGGARNVVFAPRFVLDYRTLESWHLGLNAGVSIREATVFHNIDAGSEVTYGAAVAYRIGGHQGPVELGAELNGGIGILQQQREELPLEAFPFAKIFPSEEWEVVGGPGIGIIPGYGVPILRGFIGFRYRPTSHDRDHDGIPDDEDKCPDQPEDRNGYEDFDGCPDADKDDDHDGIPNYRDQCPNQKETINGFQDEDGCPDGGPAKVIREEGRFRVLENVRFRSGKAQIDPASYSILDQVALTLKANPDIEHMRVEGHTDETGSHDMNMRLSKERAESVRQYLVAKGVRSSRLRAEGYGPDRPLVKGTDPASRAKNRRVEFVIE